MSNVMRYRYGATNPILVPVDSAQVIEIGDFVWLNTDDARPASAQTDQLSETANQREFKRLFLGIAMQQSRAGDTDSIRIATSGTFEFICASASTYEIGDLVAVDEDSGGTALEDQTVVEVSDDELAIGRVAKREAGSTVTSLYITIHSTIMAPTNGGGGGSFDGGVIGDTVAQTVSNGDGATNLIPTLQILGTTSADGSLLIGTWNTTNDTTVAPKLGFLKSGSGTLGSNTTVADAEVLGEIIWYGADGTDFESPAARIFCAVGNTVGTGDMPGELFFQTTADGGETLTTALRINEAQQAVWADTTPVTVSNGDGSTDCIPKIQILGTTRATSSLLLGSFNTTDTTAVAPSLNFLKSGNATLGSMATTVANAEILGEICWFGADGTDGESPAARIYATCSSTVGTGDMPGSIVFQTTADGGETLTTALTISETQTVTASKGFMAKSNQAAAITTTRTLTAADSGGFFTVAKTSAYAITLPTPQQGLDFSFVVLDTGANVVTISDGSAHLLGTVSVNNVSTAMTGTTLSLASAGSVGDWVRFQGISATQYLVTGACIAAADITIA